MGRFPTTVKVGGKEFTRDGPLHRSRDLAEFFAERRRNQGFKATIRSGEVTLTFDGRTGKRWLVYTRPTKERLLGQF